jgi:hypothetical protein
MSDRPRYSLEDDIEQAEAEDDARKLPEQLALLRERVRAAGAKIQLAGDEEDRPSD